MMYLSEFLPDNALLYIKEWLGDHQTQIKLTKNRASKLGDYRKNPNGTHTITINSTLDADLFFLVLTHELAHLLAFETYGRAILPHGKEWKLTFGKMILQSLSIYKEDLRPLLVKFSKSPKANFMASEDLVRYFRPENDDENTIYVEQLSEGEQFIFRKNFYQYLGRMRKNHLCLRLDTKKKYLFKGVTLVERNILSI